MFYNCASLTSILSTLTIPNSVTDCSYTFYNCASLTSAIPDAWNNSPPPTVHSYYALKCIKALNYADIPVGWK